MFDTYRKVQLKVALDFTTPYVYTSTPERQGEVANDTFPAIAANRFSFNLVGDLHDAEHFLSTYTRESKEETFRLNYVRAEYVLVMDYDFDNEVWQYEYYASPHCRNHRLIECGYIGKERALYKYTDPMFTNKII